jgi:Tol biopolymer transport system component
MMRCCSRIALIVFIAWMTCCSPSPKTEDYQIAIIASQIKQPGIAVMKSDGSERTLLLSDPSARLITASWSPDGNKIAFFSTRPSDPGTTNEDPIPYHDTLYEIDVSSGKEKRLLDMPASNFRWSPDGKHMLFISSYEDPDQAKSAVYILDLQTGGQRRVTDFGQGTSATWSPDGTQIAFSMGDDKTSDVYIVSFDGQSTRCLTDSKTVNARPAWSPDGKTIAYLAMNPLGLGNTDVGVYAVNPDGTNRKMISSIMAYSALWSPDGKLLLIQWDGGASLMDAEGTKSTNISPSVSYPLDMVFSPDGKKIVFRSSHGGGWHIYAMNLNGSRLKKISELIAPAFCLSPLSATQ